MPSSRLTFPGAQGQSLAARFDAPEGLLRATALFAHCFTCGKDLRAANRLAEALAVRGIAVLRFDFTGLGASAGEFANTGFRSNVDDLVAAADYLREHHEAPQILIGHSFGGTAVLAAADRIPESVAVVTIGAPADPAHVTHLFRSSLAEIERAGVAEVAIAGRTFTISRAFLDDLKSQNQIERIRNLRKALLIFHAPRDEIVGIENASKIFAVAKHPKSFVSLDGADHLLSRPQDAAFVAEVLAAWTGRYLWPAATVSAESETGPEDEDVLVEETGQGLFQQSVLMGRHQLLADEPVAAGGLDSGPSPYDLLAAALGTCTAMTLRLYARQKNWPLERISVRVMHKKIHAADCAECETREGKIDRFTRTLFLDGPLDESQRARLAEIAGKCPVHRTLTSEVSIVTRLLR